MLVKARSINPDDSSDMTIKASVIV